jgi:hypothetical protein
MFELDEIPAGVKHKKYHDKGGRLYVKGSIGSL